MSLLIQTRAQAIGVKPKVLVARTRKAVAECRKRIVALSAPWCDVDESVRGRVDDLLTRFDEFTDYLKNSEEWLNEEVGS